MGNAYAVYLPVYLKIFVDETHKGKSFFKGVALSHMDND